MKQFWDLNVDDKSLPAIVTQGRTLSYKDLDILVSEAETYLKQCTSNVKQVIGIEFDLSIEAIVNYLAALRANYPILIVEPGQLTQGSGLAENWMPLYVYSSNNNKNILNEFPHGSVYDDFHIDLAVLLSTSGTTGDPKLVRLSKDNISSNASSIAEYLDLKKSDVAATTLPLFYSYGLSVLNSYLYAGASIFLTNLPVSEQGFWDQARQNNVTSLALVPHQFSVLKNLEFDGQMLPSLRYITQAGGKLSKEYVEEFHTHGVNNDWQLFIMYGQTEASPRISYVPPEYLPEASSTIGVAVPGGELTIKNDELSETTVPGAKGELVYRGPNVMMGYATEPAHLSKPDETTVLLTGDIAEITSDGLFRIIGRAKRFIKILGKRVSLDQIESNLAEYDISCVASGNDQKLVLFIFKGEREKARRKTCELFGLPAGGIIVADLDEAPLLPSGKIDYRQLNETANELISTSNKNNNEESLLDYIKIITKNQKLTWEDSFKTAGGDSLAYLEAQLYFQEKLGFIPRLWESKSLSDLQNEFFVPGGVTKRKNETKYAIISTDAILRTLAISAVVLQHATTYPVFGGTWVLFVLMGYSFAKYQSTSIMKSRPLEILKTNLIPIVPLYFFIICSYSLLKDTPNPEFFFLFGNYSDASNTKLLEPLWFVSAYAQLIALIFLFAVIRPLRTLVSVRFDYILIPMLVASMVIYLVEMYFFDSFKGGYPYEHGVVNCILLFCIGISLAEKLKFSLLITMLVTSLWVLIEAVETGKLSTIALILATILVISFFKEVVLPNKIARFFLKVSSLSLFIYLTHQFPANVFGYRINALQDSQLLIAILTLVFAILLAQITKSIYEFGARKLRGLTSK